MHALAALAHWLLTGSAPPSVSRRRANEPGCWAELERAEVDPLRRRAWRSALALDPSDRLGTVAALRMALGWSERPAPPVSAPRPPPVSPPPPAAAAVPRRDRFSPVALVGLVVSLALGFGLLWLNREPLPPPAESLPAVEPAAVLVAPMPVPVPVPPAPTPQAVTPPVTQAASKPAPAPAPVQAARTPSPPPPQPIRPAPLPAPVPVQKNRAPASEACIDWLRRRSLEPTGEGRGDPPPAACR